MTRHRISLEEFHRMVEARVFPGDLRLELVEGELLEMSPIGKRHAAKVAKLTALFSPLVPHKAILFVQSPLMVGDSELYPDLALLRPRADFYEEHLPQGQEAFLVVEVADTSLHHDLGVTVPFYAKGGVSEVWVVDLEGRRVLVHREPRGGGYKEVRTLGPGDTTPPWLAPGWGPRKGPPVGVISLGLRERNKRKGYETLAFMGVEIPVGELL